MSDKITLTRAQFDAINELTKGYTEINIRTHANNPKQWANKNLHNVPLLAFCIDLYRPEDIVIEQTVEEQLLSNYESVREFSSPFEQGWKDGFKSALNIIGMKVKGINE